MGPKTCGVCKDANPSSKSASAVKGKSKTKKKSATKVIKSEKKKKSTTKVIQSTDGKTRVSSSKIDLPAAKPCEDTEGETDISIAGKPATCAKLAPYCKV